jgi:hypothetical protein
MQKLKQQVAKARRRLIVEQFLGALVWSWFATLVVAAIAIGVQKWMLVNVDGWLWAVQWLSGAMAVGLLAALVWTWWVRKPELAAAIEIDRRFGLKERISSSLALSAEDLETPAGQALVDDAQRRVDRLEVTNQFPIKMNRRAWLPILPAVLAFALCFLSDPIEPTSADAKANTVAITKQINESVKPLAKKMEDRAQQAAKDGLKDAEDLFKKIEEGSRDLAKKDETDKHEALSKLNDLAQQLEQRRDKLAAGEKLKEQLAGMKSLPSGPADKLAQDLKNGNLDKALKELEKLKEQLSQGKLDPEKQKELANQMQAMKDSLQKIADAHQKAQEELSKKIEAANKAGDQQTAKNLQQQLAKLQQQQPQMAQMKDMASKMGQCSESMKAGDMQAAQKALAQMAGQLGEMQQEMAEMQMMSAALDELSDCKNAMACSNCNGEGCELCRGHSGNSFSDHGKANGAEGERPENVHNTKMYDDKVKQNVGKGSAAITGLVDGPNSKGQVVEEIKSQVEAAKHEEADPLTGQRLPRSQRDHVQQYFDSFRKGN